VHHNIKTNEFGFLESNKRVTVTRIIVEFVERKH